MMLKYLPREELLKLRRDIDKLLIGEAQVMCRQCSKPFQKKKRSNLCKNCKIKNDRETRQKRYRKNKSNSLSEP